MGTLHHVLLHQSSGRWNEAHNLVLSDHYLMGFWLHGILHVQENA